MKCNCKDEFTAILETHFKTTLPEGHRDFNASLEGYGLGMDVTKNAFVSHFRIPYTGSVMVPKKSGGMKKQVIKSFIVALYCPFCGKPQSDEGVPNES